MDQPDHPGMPDHRKPRILFVDNSENNPLPTRERYLRLLQAWGYKPVIAVGIGKALQKDALRKAREHRCCIALIDLRLVDDSDDTDTSGITLAKQMEATRPIIISGFGNQANLRELMDQLPNIRFISKGDAPELRRKILDEEVAKVSASKSGLILHNLDDVLGHIAGAKFGSFTREYPDQVADIFKRLFPKAREITIRRLNWGSPLSHTSTVPRPRSMILKVDVDDADPVLVKLARPGRIKMEIQNYDTFLERRRGNFIPRLEGNAVLWDIGGAAYSFIDEFDARPFSRFAEENSVEDIREGLRSFFTRVWRRWYESAPSEKDMDLLGLYNSVWGDWFKENEFEQNPSRSDILDQLSAAFALPDPINWFKSRILGSSSGSFGRMVRTRTCITHGDLHGDNLLIDNHGNAWPIDFERTGEGHILQDFIELEADIIMRLDNLLDNPADFPQLWFPVASQRELGVLDETWMNCENPRIQKTLRTISCLRELAFECTGVNDARQYVLGLLFNALFRAKIASGRKDSDRQRRALVLAAVLCHRLEHWDETWPPENWPHLPQLKEESNA